MKRLLPAAIIVAAAFLLLVAPSLVNAQGTGTILQLNPFIISGNQVRLASTTAVVRIPGLTSCDTIDTDGNGVLVCGTDGGGGAGGGIASSSPWTTSGVLYLRSNGNVSTEATTTLAFTGPFTGASSLGRLIGGSNSTVVWTGLATTSQPSSSQVLTSNGGAGVYGTGTTSVTIGTGLSYSGTMGAVLGGVAGTLTATLGTTVGSNELVGQPYTTGNLLYAAASNAIEDVATTTLSGTANQFTFTNSPVVIGASGAVGSLSNHVIFPSSFFASLSSTTNATSTNHDITGLFSFGTVTGNSWDDFCTSITGGAGLCDGVDATGAGGSAAVATSTSETRGQLSYWTSTAGTPAMLGSVATSSVTCLSVVACQNLVSVGAAAPTITIGAGTTNTVLVTNGIDEVAWEKLDLSNQVQGTLPVANGGTGTTTVPSGWVLYGGGGLYRARATTTVSCAGSVSCTTFDVLGASPITITGSGGGASFGQSWEIGANGNTGFLAPTTTQKVWVGQASSTQFSATRADLGGTSTTTFFANGDVGIATSSPTKKFSVTGETWASATSTVYGLNVFGQTAATSTLYMYSAAASKGAEIIWEDIDGAGCTRQYALNGVITAETVTCPTEI